ncbi:MAG: DMT family transporter [Lachnospiraceae bacterium]|nr:DMT family transporter [Lachnospiraceae bacterium]
MLWMLLTLFYGVVKGLREIVKKKSLEKSTVTEVLFFYTLIGFCILLPDVGEVTIMAPKFFALVALKSFVIFVAWLCGFRAIKEIPVSLYGLLDLSRVLFAMLLGVLLLKEVLSTGQIIGMCLVALGLAALRFEDKVHALLQGGKRAEEEERREAGAGSPAGAEKEKKGHLWIFVTLSFLSAFLNAVSGTMDKILTKEISSADLQFWYMLFLLLFYALYILCRKVRINWKQTAKNGWIWILSILFILADRALFVANSIPDSRVTVMTLIKQSGCIVTILGGRLVFKEKGIGYKLCCAAVIIAGIMTGVM